METRTVYVSGNGDGDFNCDGYNDHEEINKALKYVGSRTDYDTVHLSGAERYVIDSPLLMYPNTILQGDSDAVLTIKDGNSWAKDIPMIKQAAPNKSKPGKLTVRGFEIDGNYIGNAHKLRGKSFHTLMWFYYDAVEVYNMFLHDSHNDGLKVKESKSVKFHDNRIHKLGHDALYAIQCENIDYYGNTCRTKTNSACRLYNSNHAKIHDNKIYTEFESDAGGPGIQIQYIREDTPQPMNDIEVYRNVLTDTYGPGIWLIGLGKPYAKWEAQNVHIHDNVFSGCGTHPTYNWLAGIVFSGFYDTLIENNLFLRNHGAAIAHMYPNDPRFSGLAPTGSHKPYTTTVRGNVILDTILRKGTSGGTIAADPKKTGIGIVDYYPAIHDFKLDRNYLYGNVGGNYLNAESKTDYHFKPIDPAFLKFTCTEEQLSELEKTISGYPLYKRR